MKYHKQLFKHRPQDGVISDCWRTAIACLLDKNSPEDVPHFLETKQTADEFYERTDAWLKEQGYGIFTAVFDAKRDKDRGPKNVIAGVSGQNPGMYFILAGLSATNENNVVICCDGEVVHDPSIDDAGIIGPCMPDDRYYYVYVLVPLFHRKLS